MTRPVVAVFLAFIGGCVSPPLPPAASRPAGPPAGPRLLAVHPLPAPASSVQNLAQVTIGAVGDVLMHGAVKSCAAAHRVPPSASSPGNDDGFGWLYAPVADLLSEPDLTFANLETPVAPAANRGTRSMVFNAPPSAVRALARAGVDVVSVANNHAFDQGRAGFLETLQQLDALGMPYVGAGTDGDGKRRFTVNGLTIDFLGFASFFNLGGNDCPPQKRPAACLQAAKADPERAVAAVRAAAAESDAVVVSIHWGVEYASQPTPETIELAHRLADAGALLVLGHHPHVLQPVELYEREDGRLAVIVYSLGNFISNQSRRYIEGVTRAKDGLTRDSALVRVTLAKRDYGRGVIRVEVTSADYAPLWTENDTLEVGSRKSRGLVPSIRVVAIDRALAEVRAALAEIPDPVPRERAADYVKLRRREELYLKRKEAIAAVLGEDLEREVPAFPAVEPPAAVSPSR